MASLNPDIQLGSIQSIIKVLVTAQMDFAPAFATPKNTREYQEFQILTV